MTQAANTDHLKRCLWCDEVGDEPSWQGVADRLRYVPGRWNFRRCRNCGSVQVDPLPAAEQLASFYPPTYDPEMPTAQPSRPLRLARLLEQKAFFQLTYRLQTRRLLQAIATDSEAGCGGIKTDGGRTAVAGAAREIAQKVQRTIANTSTGPCSGRCEARAPELSRIMLDIGCGRGMRMEEFHRRGYQVEGVDFQSAAVDHVRRELQLPAWCLDVHEIGTRWPSSSFDLITAFYVLEHLTEPSPLVRSCWSLLRPGGALVAAVPLADSWQARRWGARWSQVTEVPRHVSLPTRAAVRRLMSRSGFSQVRILPDTTLACAAIAGLSRVPSAAATHGARAPASRSLAIRAAGAAAAAMLVPWTWAENHLTSRPAAGLVVGIKRNSGKAPVGSTPAGTGNPAP